MQGHFKLKGREKGTSRRGILHTRDKFLQGGRDETDQWRGAAGIIYFIERAEIAQTLGNPLELPLGERIPP